MNKKNAVRVAVLALAVAMVVLGALGAAYLATSLGQTTAVIAVAREVPWGEQITAEDLVEARVSADPALDPIPFGDRDEVIGMVAATTLTPGSLLTREALTAQPLPPPGQQLVGIGVSTVQLPTTPLRPGDDVLLVPVAAGGGTPMMGGAGVAPQPVAAPEAANPNPPVCKAGQYDDCVQASDRRSSRARSRRR